MPRRIYTKFWLKIRASGARQTACTHRSRTQKRRQETMPRIRRSISLHREIQTSIIRGYVTESSTHGLEIYRTPGYYSTRSAQKIPANSRPYKSLAMHRKQRISNRQHITIPEAHDAACIRSITEFMPLSNAIKPALLTKSASCPPCSDLASPFPSHRYQRNKIFSRKDAESAPPQHGI